MKRIDEVLYREVTPPSVIALLVLTFVVFSREFGRLAELLIRKNAGGLTVLEVVVSLLPSILIFTLPISFLIGVLIGFSRLSSDSEIVAMRANGVSLYQMVWPVLRAGIAVTLLTLVFTLFLLPRGNWNLRQIRHQIGVQPVNSTIKPRVFNEDLPDKVLYVEDIDLASSSWEGVFLADLAAGGEQRIILAREGRVVLSPDSRKLQLNFEGGLIYTANKQTPEKSSLTRFREQEIAVRFPEMEEARNRPKRPGDKNLEELLADLGEGDADRRRTSMVELQSRVALPLSALIFALLGVTLGVNTHRGGRSYGFILSVTIAFIYYLLFATGSRLAGAGVLPLAAGVWGGNLLLAAAGLWSLYSSASGSPLIDHITNNRLLLGAIDGLRGLVEGARRRLRKISSRASRWMWNSRGPGFRLAGVVDLYIMRSFFFFLMVTLAICVALFYLFTFLELVDDVIANQAPYALLGDYFIYLLPHILTLLVPMSILIATLVSFGILDKTNQVVAFKACGISLYRISLPVFSLALLTAAFLFVVQEYIMPYSNQRQDNLRNVIKGRPVQTFYYPGRKWIFGEGGRLYSYNYYDSEHRIFAELSIYGLDIRSNSLYQHIYAQKAEWDPVAQQWRLSHGWVRDFGEAGDRFAAFEEESFPVAEGPDYFVKEVKESSKMTYPELRAYIADLQKGGFEVDHLRTDLYKKIAFPAVNLIMVVLGVPFAFSMGRKGALYGVALGVLIGIIYWGAFGVFGVLGVNGMLSPLLAAWGPNILFATGGSVLLLTVRT